MRILSILLVASVCLFSCNRHSSSGYANNGLIGRWALSTLSDTTFVIPAGIMYMQLDSKNAVTGESGCNSFSGSYTVDGNRLFIKNLVSTLVSCNYDRLEAKFMDALKETNHYSISNGTLYLYNDAVPRATLTAMP